MSDVKLSLVRIKEPLVEDRTCPITCGRCCAEVGVHPVSREHYLPNVGQPEHAGYMPCPCLALPHETPGCRLPRSERPLACTGYLCPLARAVVAGKLPLAEAQALAAKIRPWLYRPTLAKADLVLVEAGPTQVAG